jgi:hypothetical protein
MVNTASTVLARALVGLIWHVDHVFHPSIKTISKGA